MDLPERFYAFVSLLHPIAAHNLRFTKSIVSPAVYMLDQPGLRERYLQDEIDWLDFEILRFYVPLRSQPPRLD